MKRSSTGQSGGRPTIMATRGVVSSGHYLASGIGLEILRRGGNAMDAAAATGFALAVLKPHQNGIGGEVPMLVYSSAEKKVWAVSGHGVAPRGATLERFLSYGLEAIPGDGFLPAVVPPAPASWILLLARFGTMRLTDVLMPAIELAEQGFPVCDSLYDRIVNYAERIRRDWPTSAELFLPGGDPPPIGTVWRNPDWGRTFRRLLAAESRFAKRADGLTAAHDAFYRSKFAEEIVGFSQTAVMDASGTSHAGLLTAEDFADYRARTEEPVQTTYRDLTVYKCGPWTQGPAMLQALNLVEALRASQMGHNSADYIHTVAECLKLAYADREFYYGDPEFVSVPLDRLLSKAYAAERAGLVDPARASQELRPGGHPALRAENAGQVDRAFVRQSGGDHGDTTKLDVIDRAGNMVSATPSGGWLMSSPVVPGLGFPLGTRGQMFSLAKGHPNVVAPGKRPRTTLTPSLATRAGDPFMVFGSPGGDSQDQWALQFFLNVIDFGMSLQEATEAATFWTRHFPDSFHPRAAEPGSLYLEGRINPSVRQELARRGHLIREAGDWAGGNTLAAAIDPVTGVRLAAASPRLDPSYAVGY